MPFLRMPFKEFIRALNTNVSFSINGDIFNDPDHTVITYTLENGVYTVYLLKPDNRRTQFRIPIGPRVRIRIELEYYQGFIIITMIQADAQGMLLLETSERRRPPTEAEYYGHYYD
jgi:hypothetical protein